MKIRILKEGVTQIFNGDYQYIEGQSRQEGKPSFFFATGNGKEYYELEFSSDNISEIDQLIIDLKEIKENFEKK